MFSSQKKLHGLLEVPKVIINHKKMIWFNNLKMNGKDHMMLLIILNWLIMKTPSANWSLLKGQVITQNHYQLWVEKIFILI